MRTLWLLLGILVGMILSLILFFIPYATNSIHAPKTGEKYINVDLAKSEMIYIVNIGLDLDNTVYKSKADTNKFCHSSYTPKATVSNRGTYMGMLPRIRDDPRAV